jgi:hypothetical protein
VNDLLLRLYNITIKDDKFDEFEFKINKEAHLNAFTKTR